MVSSGSENNRLKGARIVPRGVVLLVAVTEA